MARRCRDAAARIPVRKVFARRLHRANLDAFALEANGAVA